MLQLGEFDLQLTLEAARTLREYVEDESRTVHDPPAQLLLEVAFLGGRQRMVDQDDIGCGRRDQ